MADEKKTANVGSPRAKEAATDVDSSARIAELEAQVEDLRRAAALGNRFDKGVYEAARDRKRVLVQFRVNYGCTPQESPFFKGQHFVKGYQARAGQVALIDEDEAERLANQRSVKHIPGTANAKGRVELVPVIETDRKKFQPQHIHRLVPRLDGRGRTIYDRETHEISVDELVKNAEPLG